jgi:hypothetical protein
MKQRFAIAALGVLLPLLVLLGVGLIRPAPAALADHNAETRLLYPFVTNQAGFDTGYTISNTTADPFGTTPQSGTCTLHFFGSVPGGGATPAPIVTGTIEPGQTATAVLSSGGTHGITAAPGFQGYMIADCAFRRAYGFAFVTDGPIGQARVAEGYLAIVLDEDQREGSNDNSDN